MALSARKRWRGGARVAGTTRLRWMVLTLGILSTCAALMPRAADLWTHRRLANEVQAFVQDFNHARELARRSGRSVLMCPRPPLHPLAPDPSQRARCAAHGPFAWENGWLVFGLDTSGSSLANSRDMTLEVTRESWTSTDTFQARGPAPSRILVSPDGHVDGMPGGLLTLVARTQPTEAGFLRCVRISGAGTLLVEDHESGCR